MPIPGIIASSYKTGTIYYFTDSETWTPPYYPFTYDAYIVGGGGAGSNSAVNFYSPINEEFSTAYGGAGGSGFLTVQSSVTVNTGTIAVTIGSGGTTGGGAGGTSSVANYNATGGSGGGNNANAGSPGKGGNGGSGGAEGSFDGTGGNSSWDGGTAGGRGDPNTANAGTGQNSNNSRTGNDSRVPPGGNGAGGRQNYNGVSIWGVSYGANLGRGGGGGASAANNRNGNDGFAIIVEK